MSKKDKPYDGKSQLVHDPKLPIDGINNTGTAGFNIPISGEKERKQENQGKRSSLYASLTNTTVSPDNKDFDAKFNMPLPESKNSMDVALEDTEVQSPQEAQLQEVPNNGEIDGGMKIDPPAEPVSILPVNPDLPGTDIKSHSIVCSEVLAKALEALKNMISYLVWKQGQSQFQDFDSISNPKETISVASQNIQKVEDIKVIVEDVAAEKDKAHTVLDKYKPSG